MSGKKKSQKEQGTLKQTGGDCPTLAPSLGERKGLDIGKLFGKHIGGQGTEEKKIKVIWCLINKTSGGWGQDGQKEKQHYYWVVAFGTDLEGGR